MVSNIADHAKHMLELLEDIKNYRDKKEELKKITEQINKLPREQQEQKKREQLKGKTYEEITKSYDQQILNLLGNIEEQNSEIYHIVELESYITTAPGSISKEAVTKAEVTLPISKEPLKYLRLSKKELNNLIDELNISKEYVKDFVKKQTKQKGIVIKREYSIYSPSGIGKFVNTFMNNFTISITKNYPQLFKKLSDDFKKADIKMLFKTYVSLMIFFTIISFPIFIILFSILFRGVITGILLGIVGTALTLALFYLYPSNLANKRRKKIKNDLPFAMIHMSAVAGSGARPIDIFDLMLSSGEYEELGKEINKIMNYVNLFGYDLTTALKNVAATTPSPDFKELLNGMISAIETGGDLKGYLEGKAIDELNTYKLERKKYVESLETYSDIYTAILIAAPLLFIVVLAIINTIGGQIGGFSVATLATFGTYGLIPILNIGFIVFLTISQPEI